MQEKIRDFLSQKIWAVVGVSENTSKYGYKVYQKLKKSGYTVYPINPKLSDIEGDPCFPTLSALPTLPDAVSVIVPPKVTEQIIDQCAELGIKRVWMQPGAESQEAIKKGQEKGIITIANECVLVETDRAAGMDHQPL